MGMDLPDDILTRVVFPRLTEDDLLAMEHVNVRLYALCSSERRRRLGFNVPNAPTFVFSRQFDVFTDASLDTPATDAYLSNNVWIQLALDDVLRSSAFSDRWMRIGRSYVHSVNLVVTRPGWYSVTVKTKRTLSRAEHEWLRARIGHLALASRSINVGCVWITLE